MLELRIAKSIVQILKNLAEWQTPKTHGNRKPVYARIYADYASFVNLIPTSNHKHSSTIHRLDRLLSKLIDSMRNINLFESVSYELDKENREKAEELLINEFEHTRSHVLLVVKEMCNGLAGSLGSFVVQMYICYTLLAQEKAKGFFLFDLTAHSAAVDKLTDLSGNEFGDYNDIVDDVLDNLSEASTAIASYRKYKNSSKISSGKFYSVLISKIRNTEKILEDIMCYSLQ